MRLDISACLTRKAEDLTDVKGRVGELVFAALLVGG